MYEKLILEEPIEEDLKCKSANENLHAFYYPWYGTPEVDGGTGAQKYKITILVVSFENIGCLTKFSIILIFNKISEKLEAITL